LLTKLTLLNFIYYSVINNKEVLNVAIMLRIGYGR